MQQSQNQLILNEVENLLLEIDGLDKNIIKERLIKISLLFNFYTCPRCEGVYDPIKKLGKDFFSDARYDSAETTYNICGGCGYFEPNY